MADLNVSVGLEVDTSGYEQGLAHAEELLRGLSGMMTSAVAQVQQATGEVASAWQGINGSILQAVQQASALAAISAAQPGAFGKAQPGVSAGSIGQSVAEALNGLTVTLDGQQVGALVAPAVNQHIAAAAAARRFAAV